MAPQASRSCTWISCRNLVEQFFSSAGSTDDQSVGKASVCQLHSLTCVLELWRGVISKLAGVDDRRVNNIDVELHLVNIPKGAHKTPEFKAINPLGKVPCIVDGRFKLAESHAIMQYLASTRPGVADHWYPTDVQRRCKIQSFLDWHHLNVRRGSMTLVFNKVIAPVLGTELDPRAAAEGLAILEQSLHIMETVGLHEGYPFLARGREPSIADLSIVCEIMQLQLLGEDEAAAILSSKGRVTAWISAVKKATSPHFDEVPKMLYRSAARRAQGSQQLKADTGSVINGEGSKPPVSKL